MAQPLEKLARTRIAVVDFFFKTLKTHFYICGL